MGAQAAPVIETVIINNNPETVSTDFDTADRLYFEPLTPEDVMNVIKTEKPYGVVVAFGGQYRDKADQVSWRKPGRAHTGYQRGLHRPRPRTASASTSCLRN